MQFILVIPRTAVTQQQFTVLVHFYSQVFSIESFNFNFSSQYVLLGLTSCNTSNIMYYTVILCHKLVFLVLVRLIAIKIFNRSAALIMTLVKSSLTRSLTSRCCISGGLFDVIESPAGTCKQLLLHSPEY